MKEKLVDKIRKKKAHVAVIGLGHVGLPTAAIFADVGYRVTGADINRERVRAVSSGENPIEEPKLSKIIKTTVRRGKLKATTQISQAAKEADVVIICVPTPLTEDKQPDLSYLKEACSDIAKGLSKGKIVIVESTVPPATMEDIVAPILEKESGMKCGSEFWLVYCPERIAPGRALREFVENDRIIGGHNQESTKIAVELFKSVTTGRLLTTNSASAEVAKLAENTFRDVNIAFANELALLCEQAGVDVAEVIELSNTHPRVNIHRPGCGVGGPCLPKDPYLLTQLAKLRGFKPEIMWASRALNDHMSEHTVKMVTMALRKTGKGIVGSRIAILGAAYKGEIGDVRNSPAKKIVCELIKLSASVLVYDPYCTESFSAKRAVDFERAVKGADCIVITTDHKAFRKLNLKKIKALMRENPAIVDGRRIVNPLEARKQGFVYFGVGAKY